MKPNLIVVDDFLPNPAEVKKIALAQNFRDIEFTGKTIRGIANSYDPDFTELIGQVAGCKIIPKLTFFKLCGTDADAADRTAGDIHADISTDAQFASILYLDDPTGPLQGTAFWTHPMYDDRVSKFETSEQRNLWITEHGPILNADAKDDNLWRLNGVIGQKFNRFAVYPTDLFHSRYPRTVIGSRLIWVCFFDLDV